MFSAIQNEVNGLNNDEIDSENSELELEELYSELVDIKIDLEDLDTNMEKDEFSNDDFNKLKDLVVNGNSLLDAYRNVLPPNVFDKTKKVIKSYEEELIDNIMASDDANEYRAGLDYIISNLITIYDNKEYNLKELKDKFDNKYN